MSRHAHPRFTTHNRNQGHNAITAAAYRLGLRLFDERRQVWNDCSHRVAEAEIMKTITIGPAGAPAWVNNPEEVWNRVEACEQRKDSQVCRDVVVPLPAILTDGKATTAALWFAHYIAEQLQTPVSMALHRNPATDAMGDLKPLHERGYRVHLLYPTRRLLGSDGSQVHAGAAVEEAARQGFGTKLSPLENRRMSAGLIKNYDADWRAIGNPIADDAKGEAEPKRLQEASESPQQRPTVEPAYRPDTAPKTAPKAQRSEQANDTGAVVDLHARATTDAWVNRQEQAQADEFREQEARISDEITLSCYPDLAAARERGRLPNAGLSDRFMAHMPLPECEPEAGSLFHIGTLLWTVEKNLRTLNTVAVRLADRRAQIGRCNAAKFQRQSDLDTASRRHVAVRRRAKGWTTSHRWKVLRRHAMGGAHGDMPRTQRHLTRESDLLRRLIQEGQAAQQGTAAQLDELHGEEARLLGRIARVGANLGQLVDEIRQTHLGAIDSVLAVVSKRDRHLLSSWMSKRSFPEHMGNEEPPSPAHQSSKAEGQS